LKGAPELVATGMSRAIGAPEDYQKNAAKNSFPTNFDLRIPTAINANEVPMIEAKLKKLEIEETKRDRFSNKQQNYGD